MTTHLLGQMPALAPHNFVDGPSSTLLSDGSGVAPAAGSGGGEVPFAKVLGAALSSVNEHAVEASRLAEEFASGARDDIHGTMIATKEADIELRLVATVRNKLVDAFEDLWRLNV